MTGTPAADVPAYAQLGAVAWVGPLSFGLAGGLGSLVARHGTPMPAVWLGTVGLLAMAMMGASVAIVRWRLRRRGQRPAALGWRFAALLAVHGAAAAGFAWALRPR